ncbi:MAG: hypothetical protein AAB610_02345 [Patescibacteria group bacterium]
MSKTNTIGLPTLKEGKFELNRSGKSSKVNGRHQKKLSTEESLEVLRNAITSGAFYSTENGRTENRNE